MKDNRFVNGNIKLGTWIYNLFSLQVLMVGFGLRGLLIFGFFPSLLAACHIMYRWIVYNEYDLSISREFGRVYQTNFWKANQIGWLGTLIGLVLLLDLFVSVRFIQSAILHSLLLVVGLVFIIILVYIYPVFVRYEFDRLIDYFKQSFFIAFSSIAQTGAILLALFLLYQLYIRVLFILLFFGLPVAVGAVAWFAFQGILKAEGLKEKQMTKASMK